MSAVNNEGVPVTKAEWRLNLNKDQLQLNVGDFAVSFISCKEVGDAKERRWETFSGLKRITIGEGEDARVVRVWAKALGNEDVKASMDERKELAQKYEACLRKAILSKPGIELNNSNIKKLFDMACSMPCGSTNNMVIRGKLGEKFIWLARIRRGILVR